MSSKDGVCFYHSVFFGILINVPQTNRLKVKNNKEIEQYAIHLLSNDPMNERKSEQAHIPHAPTLLENAVYNEWQFQALGTGNRTKKGI